MTSSSIQVGIIIAHSQSTAREPLTELARQLAEDASAELAEASGRLWDFHFEEPLQLGSDERRHAGDFLNEATLRLVEGSFDLVVMLTDVALISRGERVVFGLSSPLARTVVLSTHRLREAERGRRLSLDAPALRWNAAALLLHLIGQGLGAKTCSVREGVMSPFEVRPDRGGVPEFQDGAEIRRLASAFVEREHLVGGPVSDIWLHILSAMRHPGLIMQALLRNKAPLLPIRLPGLAAAAVAPVFVLVFSAEFWDAGLGMTQLTAWVYAGISILVAAVYLCFAQRLFLPRKDTRIVPEHIAVANVVIFLSMFLAVVGLFVMVAILALAIELWVFPSDLTTGALAGGLHRRQVLRQMALFQAEV